MKNLMQLAPSGFASVHIKSLLIGVIIGIFIGGPKVLLPDNQDKSIDCAQAVNRCIKQYGKNYPNLKNELTDTTKKICEIVIKNEQQGANNANIQREITQKP